MTEENPYLGIPYRRRYPYNEPNPITEEDILDTESKETLEKGKEIKGTPEIEEPDMVDRAEQAFNSLLNAINDLARGQKEMVDLMKGMSNTRTSIGKEPLNGEGSNSAEGSQACNHVQNQSRTATKIPRPKMPHFIHETPEYIPEQSSHGIPYAEYMEEYRALGQEFQSAMSYTDFCHLQLKSRPKPFQRV